MLYSIQVTKEDIALLIAARLEQLAKAIREGDERLQQALEGDVGRLHTEMARITQNLAPAA